MPEWKLHSTFNKICLLIRFISTRIWWLGILLCLYFCNSQVVFSQQTGSNPPGVKWFFLESDSLKIIFPEGMTKEAFRVDSTVHLLMNNATYSIGNKHKKLTILLQNGQVISNGYVTLAPFRSEFFATPLQQSNETGSLPWIDLLSLHEYRHAQQFSNTFRGVTKLSYGLFGETGWNIMSGLIVPDWFWEGDAVFTETLFSEQGRGRLPAFHNQVKTLALGKRFYSYTKMRNGSYKDYLPDHYAYGYFLVQYGNEKFGPDFWKKVLAESSAGKGLFWPFAKAIRRNSGLRPSKFYKAAFRQLNENWNNDSLRIIPSEAHRLPVEEKQVTSYNYPRYLNDTTLLVYKSGFDHVPQFILKNSITGEEQKLTDAYFSVDSYYSSNGKQLVYSSLRLDKRFENRNYLDVVLLDVISGKQKFITRKGKYFSPSISSGGDTILVVKQSGGQKNELVFLNTKSGKEFKSFLNPHEYIYQYPQLSRSGNKIYSLVRNPKGEMGIIQINTSSGEEELILGFTNNVLSDPIVYREDYFLFQASFNGRDNIFGIRLIDNACFQFTNRVEGCYQPTLSPNGQELVYAAFEADGFRLFLREFAPLNDEALMIQPLNSLKMFANKSLEPPAQVLNNETSSVTKLVKKYRPIRDLIKIHSWSLISDQRSYGLSVYSNNYLNTLSADGGLMYNSNEKNLYYNMQFEYGKYYPVFFIKSDYSPYRNISTVDKEGAIISNSWKEQSIEAGIRIPLLLTRGRFHHEWTSDVFYRQLYYNPLSGSLIRGSAELIGMSIRWKHALRKSYRTPVSRFGQFVDVNFIQAVNNNQLKRIKVNSAWSLPGFFKTHSWIIEADYNRQNYSQTYRFRDEAGYNRGLTAFFHDEFLRVGISYHFPFLYPETGLPSVFYVSRIRWNPYFDWGRLTTNNNVFYYQTIGLELLLDVKWFNQFLFPIGIRYGGLTSGQIRSMDTFVPFQVFLPIIRF